jgi:hypothetical protein
MLWVSGMHCTGAPQPQSGVSLEHAQSVTGHGVVYE